MRGSQTTVILLWTVLASSLAINIEFSSTWDPEQGWMNNCSWTFEGNDVLQSLRLYYNAQQFMIYRPDADGQARSNVFQTLEASMKVDCVETSSRGRKGFCTLYVNPTQPLKNDSYFTCEVSGEGPKFQMKSKDLLAFVPPSDAVVNIIQQEDQSSSLELLNCTSFGFPAPNLVWTVDEQKIPASFTGRRWSPTTKLWHVWSSLSNTQSAHPATCTPEARQGNQLVRGNPATSKTEGLTGNIAMMLTLSTIINMVQLR